MGAAGGGGGFESVFGGWKYARVDGARLLTGLFQFDGDYCTTRAIPILFHDNFETFLSSLESTTSVFVFAIYLRRGT